MLGQVRVRVGVKVRIGVREGLFLLVATLSTRDTLEWGWVWPYGDLRHTERCVCPYDVYHHTAIVISVHWLTGSRSFSIKLISGLFQGRSETRSALMSTTSARSGGSP